MKKFYLILLISFSLFFIMISDKNANADKYVGNSTPNIIRGNWYHYIGNNHWNTIKIYKHNIIYNNDKFNKLNIYQSQLATNIKGYGSPKYLYNINNYYKNHNNSFYNDYGSIIRSNVNYGNNKVLLVSRKLPQTWTNHKVKKTSDQINNSMGVQY